MILSVTFSKAVANAEVVLGRPYIRVKINLKPKSSGAVYFAELFTDTQVFHENFDELTLNDFIEKCRGNCFKNCVIRTETEEITFLTNKKGKTTELRKSIERNIKNYASAKNIPSVNLNENNRRKNYIIQEGEPVGFLCALGVMNEQGKVISSKYDKFRQINRFLEFIDDILPYISNEGKTLNIVDFGSGKSYLTFAVHYYLTQVKKVACRITGLDLKKEVIENCNMLARKLNLKGIQFKHGDIADYEDDAPDLVITLHACDVATDFALDYAIRKNAAAILSVPCCQHEVNGQLSKNLNQLKDTEFGPLLKYGIIRERFAALVTDALRAEYLERAGYSVNVMEFIDMEGTPKNILLRAVKKNGKSDCTDGKDSVSGLMEKLKINPSLYNME